MNIHDLPGDPALEAKPMRVGRGQGSGKGKTAGRGSKGQMARAGAPRGRAHFEGGQMPLARRVPKRGFSNTSFAQRVQTVNLVDLNRFGEGETVSAEALRAKGLAKRRMPVKVLGNGPLETKGLRVEAHAFSAGARSAIEATGGTCVVVDFRAK